MTTQPTALQIADALDRGWAYKTECAEAAAELRRLHAENERYDAECLKLARSWNDAERRCDALLEALKTVEWHGGGSCWIVDADKIAAAIAKAEENNT